MNGQKGRPFFLVSGLWAVSAVFYLLHLFNLVSLPSRALITFPAANLTISWSALYVLLGFGIGLLVIFWLAAEQEGLDRGFALTAVFPTLLLALIGARLYHILTPPPSFAALGFASYRDYLANPEQILNFQRGGLGFYGALLGGALGLLFAALRQQQPFFRWLDLAAVGVAAGQALGRWSNFVAQDMVGLPTQLPWGMFIAPPFRPEPFIASPTFHPAFLYDSILMLVIFWRLFQLYHQPLRTVPAGYLALRFVLFYGLGRFLIEFLRADVRVLSLGRLDVSLTAVFALSTAVLAFLLLQTRRQGD